VSTPAPTLVALTDHALVKAQQLGIASLDVDDAVLANHEKRTRNTRASDEHVPGLEYWRASERLPADLLRMLPRHPPASPGNAAPGLHPLVQRQRRAGGRDAAPCAR
jgi:hypothetical protein